MTRFRDRVSRSWLRAIGAAVLLVAWRAGGALDGLVQRNPVHLPAIAYLLAAATFASASIGIALITMGHHLFDRVEISERWAAQRSAGEPVEDGSTCDARTGRSL